MGAFLGLFPRVDACLLWTGLGPEASHFQQCLPLIQPFNPAPLSSCSDFLDCATGNVSMNRGSKGIRAAHKAPISHLATGYNKAYTFAPMLAEPKATGF